MSVILQAPEVLRTHADSRAISPSYTTSLIGWPFPFGTGAEKPHPGVLPKDCRQRSLFTRPGEIEFGVGGADMGSGEAQFAAHYISALDQRHAFVIGDAAREAFAAKAAIGGDHQLLLRDVFECLADQRGDMLGRLDRR